MSKIKRQSSIWRRAKFMHFSGMVMSSGIGNEKEYYEINDKELGKKYTVTLKHTRQSVEFECECLNKTFNVVVPNLCSHMIVVCLKKIGDVKLK